MHIDAHFHSWLLARADYGWLTPAMGPIYRDVAVTHWQDQAQPCGIRGGVLVQAAPTEAETRYLLQLADAHDCVLGVVGWVDLSAPDAVQRIAALAAHQKLKGLRPMLQDIADPDWILQPSAQAGLAHMAQRGLVFDALVKPVHLPRIHTLAKRYPHLSIVIDHAAKPDVAAAEWLPWATDMAQLAQCPRVCCKLSGLLTEAGAQPHADAARRWSRHVLETFGPERVLWGSDWPVLELASTYAAWWQECRAIAGTDSNHIAALFGGNAQRVYHLNKPQQELT